MKQLGLIGKHLSHSFSKNYFEEKFNKLGLNNYSYDLFPIPEINQLMVILELQPNLIGLNVTIPYKEQIIPFLDDLDPEAKATGAVNCIKITNENGRKHLIGYNTDTFGFRQSIKPFLEPQHNNALIIGTGGASKAVAYVLNGIGVETSFLSRENKFNKENIFTYEQVNAAMIAHFKLIVNTTPVGMFPNTNECPEIPFESVGPQHLMYDLVYNPEETEFLKRSRDQGAVGVNGLSMLYHQADKAWEVWTT